VISFEIAAGEIVAFSGPNGAGKTEQVNEIFSKNLPVCHSN